MTEIDSVQPFDRLHGANMAKDRFWRQRQHKQISLMRLLSEAMPLLALTSLNPLFALKKRSRSL
ncbi:hypothetical protein D7S44_21735 [Pantoea piersonii]|jgi:hypothetical protein|nr:hypothetical protein D7S44_21735 [Pantoea piersonii]